ncbi:MAG TPA: methionyl-tRNA formyltransferase [Paracoccaceae bacterium]|nr:methionyl-tRNA formyltransferase [Paracoccaceae bacterium]
MRVVFMGTPGFAVPALSAIATAGHEVAAVYTQPPRPAGRGQQPRPSPVAQRAAELGLPLRDPVTLRDAAVQAALAELEVDVAVVAAYGLILPRWRGAAPIHRAVMAGDAETGICIMAMEAGLDTGPVLLRKAMPIGPEDTTGDLHDLLANLGARMIVDALARLPGLVPVPQPAEGETYAAKIDKAEARVDWSAPAALVDRRIRGLSPSPGAWCEVSGERVRLLRSRLADGAGAPGQVLGGWTVACGTGAVEVTEVQRAGRKPMRASEALLGWHLPGCLD